MKKMSLFLSAVLLLTVVFSVSCGKKVAETPVSILYPNWAEGVAFTHLAAVALEAKGYQVELTPLEPGPIYATLAKGDKDLFLDAWLPNTHGSYWEKYGDQIDKLGESFSDGTTGLVVPAYVDENSILDLNAAKDKYEGKIIGIGSGAGIHGNTEKAIEAYELDYEQITSSGPAMIASLEKAYKKEEPIIITGWKPHYKWARFDLKYLEDPKNIYPKDVCAILARQGFKEERPKVAAFFQNFNLSEDQLYGLMAIMKENNDPKAAAQQWFNENKAAVEAWWQ